MLGLPFARVARRGAPTNAPMTPTSTASAIGRHAGGRDRSIRSAPQRRGRLPAGGPRSNRRSASADDRVVAQLGDRHRSARPSRRDRRPTPGRARPARSPSRIHADAQRDDRAASQRRISVAPIAARNPHVSSQNGRKRVFQTACSGHWTNSTPSTSASDEQHERRAPAVPAGGDDRDAGEQPDPPRQPQRRRDRFTGGVGSRCRARARCPRSCARRDRAAAPRRNPTA